MPIGVDFLFSILHSLQSLLFQAPGQPLPKEDVLGRSGPRLCSLGCYRWVKQVRDLVGGLVQHPGANIASYAPAGPAAVVRGNSSDQLQLGRGGQEALIAAVCNQYLQLASSPAGHKGPARKRRTRPTLRALSRPFISRLLGCGNASLAGMDSAPARAGKKSFIGEIGQNAWGWRSRALQEQREMPQICLGSLGVSPVLAVFTPPRSPLLNARSP